MLKRTDMTALVDLTHEMGAGPVRSRRPIYVDLLAPCNHACPAGENIQAWLALPVSCRSDDPRRSTPREHWCDGSLPSIGRDLW